MSSFLKGFQLPKNCLRPQSAPLRESSKDTFFWFKILIGIMYKSIFVLKTNQLKILEITNLVNYFNLHCKSIYWFMYYEKKTCVKSVQIRSYFWSVYSCTRTEYRKIRTRSDSVFGHFSRSKSGALQIRKLVHHGQTFFFTKKKTEDDVRKNTEYKNTGCWVSSLTTATI